MDHRRLCDPEGDEDSFRRLRGWWLLLVFIKAQRIQRDDFCSASKLFRPLYAGNKHDSMGSYDSDLPTPAAEFFLAHQCFNQSPQVVLLTPSLHAICTHHPHPISSNICLCRNLLVFPRGNQSAKSIGSMSLYLNVPDSDTPPGWSRRTRFKLIVINKKPGKHITRGKHPLSRYNFRSETICQELTVICARLS